MQEFSGLSGSIKNILDSIAEEEKKKNKASDIIEVKSKKSGLEFDDSDEEETSETVIDFVEEKEDKEERTVEFSVPEKFEQSEQTSDSASQFKSLNFLGDIPVLSLNTERKEERERNPERKQASETEKPAVNKTLA